MDPFRSAPTLTTPTIVTAMRPIVRRLARTAIPGLADYCLVFAAVGSTILCAGAAHSTADGTRLVRALARTYRVRRGDRASTVATVIRTGQPTLRSDIPVENDRHPAATKWTGVADLHRRLATRSVLAVPIVSGNVVLGAVSLCYSHSGRSYVARDVPAATRLAMRIARVLTSVRVPDATVGLRPAARHPRQGTTVWRRVAARN